MATFPRSLLHSEAASLVRLAAVTFGLIAIFSLVAPDTFPSTINAQTIAFAVPEVALLGMCIMITMSTGGIDLSVVSIMNVSSISAAAVYTQGADSVPGGLLLVLALAAAVLIGAVCGLVNGLLVAVVGVAPILATLATMQLFDGVGYVWTGGRAKYGFGDAFLYLGTGSFLGVPVAMWLLATVGLAVFAMLRYTRLGISLVLVGESLMTARFSGFRTGRTVVTAYVLSGVLAALAGVLVAARSASASPDYGDSYLLLAVVIAVLAGVDPDGGRATVVGILLATLCLQVLSSGFNLTGASPYWSQITQSLVVIVILVAERSRLTHGAQSWRHVMKKISTKEQP